MSRSYHINRQELERLKKENVSLSHSWDQYLLRKRKKGELDQKRHVKKKCKKQRHANKQIEDFGWIYNDEIETHTKIVDTLITWHDDPYTFYPVSEDDVSWVLKSFSSVNTLKVKSIHFKNIDDYDEIVPGVWIPAKTYGTYNRVSDEIMICGLKIEDSDCNFLEHILFYYKVILISALSHEIFHNIDFNSIKFRKGENNTLKNSDLEEFAYSLQADFYKKVIIPYIKNNYSIEYNGFLSWMDEQGVLPLELEYWKPAAWEQYDDGIPSFFTNVYKHMHPKEMNLIFEGQMIENGFLTKSLDYCEYVLSEIDPKDYQALKAKAQLFLWRLGKYKEADSIFDSIYDPELSDKHLTLCYAGTKRKLKQYKEACHLYSLFLPLKGWDLLEYVHCLHLSNQHDKVNKLIADLKSGDYDSGIITSRTNLYLISIYSIQQNYHEALKIFDLFDDESFFYDVLWAKLVVGKIYISLRNFESARKVLSNPGNIESYSSYNLQIVNRIQNILKRIEHKR